MNMAVGRIERNKEDGDDDDNNGNDKARRPRRSKRPRHDHRFANFLVFGWGSTLCLGLFALCYVLVLVVLWPLLNASTPTELPDETARDYLHHMHVPPSLKEIAHVPGKDKIGKMAAGMRKQLQRFRQGRGVTDANLLQEAVAKYESVVADRKAEERKETKREKKREEEGAAVVAGNHRNGFVVLGMHRSGTSMLSGLLHKAAGYTVGGPLIGGAADNERGFFERIDIVLQNDEFMNKQNIWWAANVIKYDWRQALRDKESGRVTFKEGARGLPFLNNPGNAPWLQKDPRMCITLKTWLALMNNEPAIVFTYRHPLEVAMSINKRDESISLETGLRLWIVYNMRAVQNSKGLCVVRSSNDAILADPLNEVQRIADELTTKCGVPAPPRRIAQEEVEKFVDPNLQHNSNSNNNNNNKSNNKKKKQKKKQKNRVLATYNDGTCVVNNYQSTKKKGTEAWDREHDLYRKAMKVYCDFRSGIAYEDDYVWPTWQQQ
eukprot:CAMPEP_0172379810 /NCGR_PEP_ID=MMETSP1060-20121228/70120_1 /TAXON_ID=37318 /ORGANISM="Pseudo-nitzschia pungens, Strain cf. cingulata" /LENGTH=491 /DNA_ID=CAMNT_0013107555 /DNA_START=194 /DNA_END=1669 /DNA_ORIENTATION=+